MLEIKTQIRKEDESEIQGKENKRLKSYEKGKIIKQYEARKLVSQEENEKSKENQNEPVVSELRCDLEVHSIMRDITNTYSFLQTRTISPIDKEQPTCSNRNNENIDFNETISAVAGLVQETIDETREKAVENISEVAMEVV